MRALVVLGLFILALLIASFLLVIVIWQVPAWLEVASTSTLPHEQVKAKLEVYKTLGQILGGIFFVTGAYFTWRNLVIAQEGQITDRFSKAIEHLGDQSLTKQLGGVFALERIARDSKKDHWQVMEVLTAWVRDQQPGTAAQAIQAIVDVLKRRKRGYERSYQNLDLSRSQALKNLRMEKIHLEKANLTSAFLQGCVLQGAYLQRAILHEANLEGATLIDAHMQKADLTGAVLIGADLTGAILTRVKLAGAWYNKSTQWPRGFNAQKHGAEEV